MTLPLPAISSALETICCFSASLFTVPFSATLPFWSCTVTLLEIGLSVVSDLSEERTFSLMPSPAALLLCVEVDDWSGLVLVELGLVSVLLPVVLVPAPAASCVADPGWDCRFLALQIQSKRCWVERQMCVLIVALDSAPEDCIPEVCAPEDCVAEDCPPAGSLTDPELDWLIGVILVAEL